jgi:type VI secretion system secreted protein Hcp
MAVDMFLKIDGILGESRDDKHKDEIDIESFSWGETNSALGAGGTGAGTGKVSMQDFHFAAVFCKASPVLFVSCASGKHFPTATLSVRKAGGDQRQDFLKWTLSDVMISSYQTGGSEGSEVGPTEAFSLNFAKIEVSYKPQNADGQLGSEITAGWDLKRNSEV